MQRLGINIDHIATLRNARGGVHPDPLRMAMTLAEAGYTDLITIHLREDRRHIRDADVYAIRRDCPLPLNLEMAVTNEMLGIAIDVKPDWVCLVPENRHEVTTEGGLNVNNVPNLANFTRKLQENGIKVSYFIDPDAEMVELSSKLGANAVELHTGAYAHAPFGVELERLQSAAARCAELGLQCHAGHGLTFDNVGAVASIPVIEELNIGHFLVGEALWMGLPEAVKEMKRLMQAARRKP